MAAKAAADGNEHLGSIFSHFFVGGMVMGVEPKIGGFETPPKWMVKIMVPNPMNKWMIWGYHYFWKHPDGDVICDGNWFKLIQVDVVHSYLEMGSCFGQ